MAPITGCQCSAFHGNTGRPVVYMSLYCSLSTVHCDNTAAGHSCVVKRELCGVSDGYTPMAAVRHMMMSRTTHHRMSVFRCFSSWLRLYLGPLLFIMALVSWPKSHGRRRTNIFFHYLKSSACLVKLWCICQFGLLTCEMSNWWGTQLPNQVLHEESKQWFQ